MDITEITEEVKALVPENVELLEVKVDRLSPRGWRRGRVHMWPEEWKVLEDFLTRASEKAAGVQRENDRDRARFERSLVPAVLKAAGLPDQEYHWSRKAGCGCGCSPGVVLHGSHNVDVFVKFRVRLAVVRSDAA